MYCRGALCSVWILLGVRKPQNGWGWQGFLEITWSNPVPQVGSPRGLLRKTTFWQLLNISKDGDLMKSMGSLCPTLAAPQWKKCYLTLTGILLCSSLGTVPFVPSLGNTKKGLASCSLYTADVRCLYMLRFPELLFFRVPAFPHMKDAPVP